MFYPSSARCWTGRKRLHRGFARQVESIILRQRFRNRRNLQEYRAFRGWPVSSRRDYRLCCFAMSYLLRYCVQRLPDAVRFLEEMVTMESPSFDKPLIDSFAKFVGSRFAEIGGQVELKKTEKFGDHLIARFPGETSERILLLGHTDTVWPAGEIHKRPFRVESGRAFGPGVFDMKAGIALMWLALDAMRKVCGSLPKTVTVLLVSDEEIGSNSSRSLTESEAAVSRAVFVLEPALPGGRLKTARKGIGVFTIKAI